MISRLLLLLTAVTCTAACNTTDSTSAAAPTPIGEPASAISSQSQGSLSQLQSSTPDVSGAWVWSTTEHLTLPPFVAEQIFEITPEGMVTQLWCQTSGTLTLVQTGSTFTGSGTQSATCETGGGHRFDSPPTATPPTIQVNDGRIRGKALEFTVDSGGMDCPHKGAITDLDGAVATELRATGRCIVPGHPKSPVPLEPPPAGTSKSISWVATRP